MSRFLLDLNVLLDVLLDRSPHAAAASALWAEIERGRAEGFVPAHGVTTIYYLAQRARGKKFADRALADLLSVFRVALVDEGVVRRALALGWADFEDAVCAESARTAQCDALVTRNPDDYAESVVPILDPHSAVAVVAATG